jgi:hypothetical protein
MTEKDIADLIEKKYTGDAYAFLPQVANGTGGHKERTADALVMSLWPSRGLHLYGFEIKVSRGDWLGELKKPEKAESIAQYCDFWYVVAPEGIANVEEVPPNWGLMCPSANGLCLQIKKQAVELKPKDISKVFLAALLRKASATITPEARTIEAYNKGRKEGMAARDHSNECKIKEFEELKIIVKQCFTAAKTKTMGVKRGKSFCFDPWLFRGFADISGFGTINGRFQIFFVEVKTKVGTQSDMQKAFEALCKQAGVI